MIELQQLTKRYGDKLAVDGISAPIRPGVVTGFLGPNGAGKSTTMRMILGLDRPTSGAALVHGRPYVDSPAPLAEVGALLDAKAVDGGRSARNHLLALGATVGIGPRRVDEVLASVGLTEAAHQPAGSFSLGMGQRLGIAAALLIADGIRAEAPDVVLNFTTAGSRGMTDDERLASLDGGPELASLDAGSMNFGPDDDFVFINTHSFMARAAKEMRERGVKPELECFDTGMIVSANELLARELIDAPALFQLVLGVRGGAPARVDTLTHLVTLLPPGVEWGAFAVGRRHSEIMAATLALGGHIRTGMEDVAYTSKGVYATSNAELVERAVSLCQQLGRPLATPAQALDLLKLQST